MPYKEDRNREKQERKFFFTYGLLFDTEEYIGSFSCKKGY